MLELKIEIKGLDEVVKSLDPKLVRKAFPRTLNRTATAIRTARVKLAKSDTTSKRVTSREQSSFAKPGTVTRLQK